MKMIKLKIDVTKIDKSKLFKGAKGTYLDAVVFLKDEADQYGNNGMIVESITKEEREQGVKGVILGNAQISTLSQQAQPTEQEGDDLLPF
jgi:hypothetical protein